jgi:chromosome segregation ATPase
MQTSDVEDAGTQPKEVEKEALPTKPEANEIDDLSDLSISAKAAELLEFEPKSSKVDSALLQPLALLDADAEHIEAFAEEYKKLQITLRMSYESENRFINKCKTLISKIRTSSTRLTSLALHLQNDLKKKELTKKAIEANRNEKKALMEEVAQKRQLVKTLKGDIDKLQEQLESSSNHSIQQRRQMMDELVLEVSELTKVKEKDLGELTKIRIKHIDLFKKWQDELAKQRKGQEDLDNLDMKISEINAQSTKAIADKKNKKKLVQDLKAKVDEREALICDKQAILEESKQGLKRIQTTLAEREEIQNEHLAEIDRLINATQTINAKVSDSQEENDTAEKF